MISLTVLGIILTVALFNLNHPFETESSNSENEKDLPPKTKAEIEYLFLELEAINKIGTTKWPVNKAEKRIDIFVWKLIPENKRYP